MSDEELDQLHASHQKLKQPIDNSLQTELELRASRRLKAVTTPAVPLAQVVSTNQIDPTGISSVEVALAKQKLTHAPYAKFVVQILGSCFFASVGVFALFEAMARNTTAFTILAFSILFTLAGGWSTRRTWHRILVDEPENVLKVKHHHQNIFITTTVLVLLYLGMAALVGYVIGLNRAESIQFNADSEHQKELADHITKARNAVEANIPSYLLMYKVIEPDVTDYSATLLRVRREVGIYDSKFPAQHIGTAKYQAFIEREIRRSELLTKQIAVAKQIEPVAESQQWQLWQLDMLPLLKEEDGLGQAK